MQFRIEYHPEAEAELDALPAHDRRIVLAAISRSLIHQPTVVSRNRKPVVPVGLVAELGITWELRVGDYRVYYDVVTPASVVVIRIVRKGNQTTEGSLK